MPDVDSLAERRELHRSLAARWCTAPDGPCPTCVSSVPTVLASLPPGTRVLSSANGGVA